MSDAAPIRWGVIATGDIARLFAGDLALLPDARLAAVGSRTKESADAFGEQFAVPRRYGSYEALVEDPEIDAVYVATVHPGHHDAALLAIEAGKPVLVEKPFTMDATEAAELIEAARTRGTFLMEAMWTRFLPHMERVREVVKSGELGGIVSVTADFGIRAPSDPEHRAFNPLLGGGALLDLGIYPISFAWMVLGAPSLVTAVSDAAETGVDAQTSMIFQYPSGAHAVLTTTNYAATGTTASINGVAARLEIGRPFYRPASFRVLRSDDVEIDAFRMEHVGVGLRYEAAEVGRCLRAGLTESPVMPLDETLAIMETLDAIRAQIGLTYPR